MSVKWIVRNEASGERADTTFSDEGRARAHRDELAQTWEPDVYLLIKRTITEEVVP